MAIFSLANLRTPVRQRQSGQRRAMTTHSEFGLNCTETSVTDPDPGSGAFLTPEYGIRDG
jgi:hypothetical protein